MKDWNTEKVFIYLRNLSDSIFFFSYSFLATFFWVPITFERYHFQSGYDPDSQQTFLRPDTFPMDTNPADICLVRQIPNRHFSNGYSPHVHFPDQIHPRWILPQPDTFFFNSLFDCNIFPTYNFYLPDWFM